MIMVWRTLLTLCFGLGRFGTIGPDEGWWVSVLLLQFSNALLSGGQLFQQVCQVLFQLLIFGSEPLDFLLKHHAVMNTIEVRIGQM
jgi:hypothetical protein